MSLLAFDEPPFVCPEGWEAIRAFSFGASSGTSLRRTLSLGAVPGRRCVSAWAQDPSRTAVRGAGVPPSPERSADPLPCPCAPRPLPPQKLLRGHPNIVHLHDADAFHLPDGTHEVLILMEFCAGGGIIDLLNARLQARLAEHEILQIFVDVCEGVARMHSLRPKPLVHRDLKVENVLQAGERSFKLCDFGSAAFPRPPPTTLAEIKDVELDINTHTTMQYRSPEMVDVYQRRPIDEKAGACPNPLAAARARARFRLLLAAQG